MASTHRPRVYVAAAPSYAPDDLLAAVRRGLQHVRPELGENLLVQSDWSGGRRDLTPSASTRPEVARAVLEALLPAHPNRLALLSGRGGLEVPSRRALSRARSDTPPFRRRGFAALARMFRKQVALRPGDESRLYRYQLSVGDRLDRRQREDPGRVLPPEERYWERVVASWELYHADSLLLLPKLRRDGELHGLAGAIALLGASLLRPEDSDLGGQRVRDHRLVDLLEIADPDLIVTDAVSLGWGGSSLCQGGKPLGVLVVANNALAHDAVCARMVGLDPSRVRYLEVAASRGYGTWDEAEIDLHSEVDFDRTRLKVRGFAGPQPRNASAFRRWFQDQTGFALGLEVLAGDTQSEGTAARLLSWLMAAWDHPGTREAMKSWPDISMVVGVNNNGPRYARVALIGNRAISDFRRHSLSVQTWLRIPLRLRRSFGGISSVLRFRLRDGRSGWAVTIPGDPPSLREMSVGLWFFTLSRIRSPLLAVEGPFDRLWFRFLAFLRRRRRNSMGIPVVHARKIERLQTRSWRCLWGQPTRLRLRKTPEKSLQPPPAGTSA